MDLVRKDRRFNCDNFVVNVCDKEFGPEGVINTLEDFSIDWIHTDTGSGQRKILTAVVEAATTSCWDWGTNAGVAASPRIQELAAKILNNAPEVAIPALIAEVLGGDQDRTLGAIATLDQMRALALDPDLSGHALWTAEQHKKVIDVAVGFIDNSNPAIAAYAEGILKHRGARDPEEKRDVRSKHDSQPSESPEACTIDRNSFRKTLLDGFLGDARECTVETPTFGCHIIQKADGGYWIGVRDLNPKGKRSQLPDIKIIVGPRGALSEINYHAPDTADFRLMITMLGRFQINQGPLHPRKVNFAAKVFSELAGGLEE